MSADELGIAVFVRPIVKGAVKTRLAAGVGPDLAARLYRAFIDDTVARLRALSIGRATLWVAGDPEHPSLSDVAPDWPRARQPDADLGRRQAVALTHTLATHPRALAIGTDSPTLGGATLTAAAAALADGPLVLGPAADGGYYLLGVRAPFPSGLLSDVRWSSRHTLADVCRNGQQLGLATHMLCPHYDVDDARDLALLRMHLQLDPAAAPCSARALREPG